MSYYDYDNAIIHYFPLSPFIAKAQVNLRCGSKILMRVPMKDADAAAVWLFEHFPELPIRTITQC